MADKTLVAENLRRLRTAQGFTQEQVAAVLSVKRSTYSYYERGKTEPSLAAAVRLSRFFSVSLEELLGC